MLASPLGSSETHILRIFEGVTKRNMNIFMAHPLLNSLGRSLTNLLEGTRDTLLLKGGGIG
jgi:hypothetical protein